MTHVRIRAAALEDAETLADLHLDVWEEAYGHLMPAAILRDRRTRRSERITAWRQNIQVMQSSGVLTLLAWGQEGDRLLGFVTSGPRRDEPLPGLPDLEVYALYVRAEVYGHGVGHALATEAIGSADAYLWVLDGNERAIEFYERHGFRFDGAAKTEPEGRELRMVRCNRPGP